MPTLGTLQIASLIGGIGIFLLGMNIMTQGLRLAAGRALPRILHGWTRTPLRGVATGTLITALVQSSSAVTVATLGFVNAGLVGLAQASAVIYGANLGTTMTSWIVALLGFKVNLKLLALWLVAVGMLLRLGGGESRRSGFGEALAGFALFFLGIDLLISGFGDIGASFEPELLTGTGLPVLLASVAAGFLLTALVQSSSAATAVALTATAGGLMSIENAAGMVIGANLGTTTTAMLAAISATPNARRAASVHVIFNIVAALAALALLPLLLYLLRLAWALFGAVPEPATFLALFHTLFNLIGIAIMLPLTSRLLVYVEKRFVSAEETAGRPRYLDRNTLQTPMLAINALYRELHRTGLMVAGSAHSVISSETPDLGMLAKERFSIDSLTDACAEFLSELQKSRLPEELHDSLLSVARVNRYQVEIADFADDIAERIQDDTPSELPEDLEQAIDSFKLQVIEAIDELQSKSPALDTEDVKLRIRGLKSEYQLVKTRFLKLGSGDGLSVRRVVRELEILSEMRRLGETALKAALHLGIVRQSCLEQPVGLPTSPAQ